MSYVKLGVCLSTEKKNTQRENFATSLKKSLFQVSLDLSACSKSLLVLNTSYVK